ncbi:hypothetical protein MMC25_004844 [Agyrium rufum]|nr:hypothetical protein [Agyrium rufum]
MSFGFGVGDFLAVLELASKIRKRLVGSPTQFAALQDEVKSLSHILIDLEDVESTKDLDTKQVTALEDITKDCRHVLEDLDMIRQKSDALDSRKRTKRLWKMVTLEPEEIPGFRDRVISNVSMLTQLYISVTNETVTRLARVQDYQGRLEILEWLSRSDIMTHCQLRSQCEPGTGQWLLNSAEYQHWYSNPGETLFCEGIPGDGKTLLSCIIIDDLNKKHTIFGNLAVAFLYCDYRQQKEQDIYSLVSSLTRQLAEAANTLPNEIKANYNESKRSMPKKDDMEMLLRLLIKDFSRVFFVIDALDECDYAERSSLLRTLFKIQEETNANLIITARAVPDIQACFRGKPTLTISAKVEDVQRFLRSRFDQLPSFVMKKKDLQDAIVSKIVDAIGDMFLLAQLHLDALRYKPTSRSLRLALDSLRKGSKPPRCCLRRSW